MSSRALHVRRTETRVSLLINSITRATTSTGKSRSLNGSVWAVDEGIVILEVAWLVVLGFLKQEKEVPMVVVCSLDGTWVG